MSSDQLKLNECKLCGKWKKISDTDYNWDPAKIKNHKWLEQAISFILTFIGTDIYAIEYSPKLKLQQNASCTPTSALKRPNSCPPSFFERHKLKISQAFVWANVYMAIKFFIFEILSLRLKYSSICSSFHNDLPSSIARLVCKFEPSGLTASVSMSSKVFGFSFFVLMLLVTNLSAKIRAKNPYQLNSINFVLDPAGELKRVDADIESLLHQTEASMSTFSAEMLNISRSRVKLIGLLDKIKIDSTSLGFLMQLLEDDWRSVTDFHQNQLVALRLSCYHESSYTKMRLFLSSLVVISTIGYFFMLTSVDLIFFFQTLDKCDQLGPKNCTFRLADYQFLLEFVVVQCGVGFVGVGLTIMLANNVLMQLSLIKGSKQELHDCLHRMDQIEVEDEQRKGSCSTYYNDSQSYWSILRKTNRLMFESMIKLKINGLELMLNSSSLELVMEIFLLVMIILVSIGISLELLGDDESRIFRLIIIIPTWLLANLTAAACAYCQARALELQRFQWCFIARAIAIFHLMDQNHVWGPTGGMGFSSVIWRRYIQSVDYWQTTLVPKPGGFVISYHTILEVNFFIISILTLSISH